VGDRSDVVIGKLVTCQIWVVLVEFAAEWTKASLLLRSATKKLAEVLVE
jgi:hypothetical protein